MFDFQSLNETFVCIAALEAITVSHEDTEKMLDCIRFLHAGNN